MIATLVLSGLLAVQAEPADIYTGADSQIDAAYEQLAAGEHDAVIARLELALIDNPADPALLINLGSAYAQTGNLARAAELYRAAQASDERYSLELANGDWVDSRLAARRALQALETRGFASR